MKIQVNVVLPQQEINLSLEDLVVTDDELKKLENSWDYSIITPPKQSK